MLCSEVDLGSYEYGVGDGNCDFVIDAFDFEEYLSCVTGPSGVATSECRVYDADVDGDVDRADQYRLQPLFTVANPRP